MLFALCWTSLCTLADETFKRIGVDDGLPNATIYSITQDQTGFIWMTSTNSGLLRYDGYQFSEFAVLTEQERKQQGSKDVGILLLDRQQNIWAGTWGYGLSRIDGKTGQLSRYVMDKNDPSSLAGMQVQALMEDAKGNIWVGSTGGINRIKPDGHIERIAAGASNGGLAHSRVWSLVESLDGSIWVATSLGLQRWREGEGFSKVLQLFPDRTARDNEIRSLYRLGDDVWVGTRFGVWRLDTHTMALQEVPFFQGGRSPIVNTITSDAQGMLLVGTYSGMYRIDPQSRQYVMFRKHQALLPTVNVRSIFLDRSGVIWLGSRENGLYYARHSKSAFSSLQAVLPRLDPEQLRQTVTAVTANERYIWLGTAAGLLEIDREQETLRKLSTAGRVNALVQGQQHEVYVATDAGLFRLTPGGTLSAVTAPFASLPNVAANIRDIKVDADGSLWLGLWGDGIVHWQPGSTTATSYMSKEMRQKIGDAVQALAVDDTSVWVGSRYSGVYQLDKRTSQVQIVDSTRGLALPSQDVQCIEPGNAGQLLICTATGLVIYNPTTQQQELLDKRAGLPSENIFGAFVDKHHDLWLMSSKGLTLRKDQTQRTITFTVQDGMVATELVFNAFYNDGRGTMYLGTIEGLSIVEPSYIWINEVPPKVAVSGIRINNQRLPQSMMQQPSSITLKPTDNAVEFEFAAFDFHDTSRNQFMYRLKGFDEDWIHQQGKHSAYYSNLPAGDYQLEVLGSNNHGLYNDVPLTLQVTVLPLWWQHRGVQIALGLLLLSVGFVVHLYRLRHMQQINRLLQESVQQKAKAQLILETKVAERTRALEESSMTLSLRTRQLEKSLAEVAKANRELKRLDQLKDEFISTVSHELRTPLTSIRGAVGLVAQKVVVPETNSYDVLLSTALENCERLSQLINDLLDVQKFESGKFSLSVKPVELIELCQQAIAGMQSYSLRYQVRLACEYPEHTEIWVNADALRLRQVFDNLLSNAVKFSKPAGLVRLSLQLVGTKVQLDVIDQGQGIPKAFQERVFEKFSQADASDTRAKEGTGLGLAICKKIVESHEGTIRFVSVEGQGTTFSIELLCCDKPS